MIFMKRFAEEENDSGGRISDPAIYHGLVKNVYNNELANPACTIAARKDENSSGDNSRDT